jgi:3-hydroxyacyl-CoA dehydrogenase/enoyl-CoA hydratase/3-hydroxybutyryl-CoA epimerase
MAFFQSDNLTVTLTGDSVATLLLDVPGRAFNVFSRQVMADLEAALRRVEDEPAVKILIIRSGKSSGFLAGADLQEFTAINSPAQAVALSEAGQRLFAQVAELRVPTVAVISGPCLGGGLEFALACDYRIVIDDPKTQLGLPEIELGLLPAWGGTQRLVRVVGLQRALQIILGGRRLDARQALAWGLADAVQGPAEPTPAFLAGAVKRPKKGLPLRSWGQRLFESNPLGRWLIFRGAEGLLRRRLPDDMPAPLEALQAVRIGLHQGMDAGLAYEREAVGRLAVTPACRNLIHLFFQREQARKPPDLFPAPVRIRHVGVVGAGTMGAGIAQLAALKGNDIVIREVNETALAGGVLRVLALFNKALEKGIITNDEFKTKMNAVKGTTAWKGFEDVDLVVEAVVEDLQAKKTVFRELEKQTSPDAILATNTSSLGVGQLQEGLRFPQRVAGLHFFNPVHKMPLVEVVRTPATEDMTVAALVNWAIRLGKTPVVVKDSPGFVVNRVLLPYLNEAVLLVAEGMAVERVDQAMRRFGMPMGPLELLDQIGLDVAAHVARSMGPVFGDRLAPHPAFRQLREKGWLGQKSGLGFYRYRGKRKRPHEAAVAVVRGGAAPADWLLGLSPADEMGQARERLVLPMANEAAACWGEGLVESREMIDLAMVLGTGWAPHRGGPLQYGQDRGFVQVVSVLEALAAQFGPRFAPCAELRRLAGAPSGPLVGQPG